MPSIPRPLPGGGVGDARVGRPGGHASGSWPCTVEETSHSRQFLTWNGWPHTAGGASRRSASGTGSSGRAAASRGGRTRCSLSKTRPSRCTAPSPPSPSGTPVAGCGRRPRCRCPQPSRRTPRSQAAGWRRGEDVRVLTAAIGGWTEPSAPVDLAGAPDAGWPRGLPLSRHAAPRCRGRHPPAGRPAGLRLRAPRPGARSAGRRRAGGAGGGLAVRDRGDRRRRPPAPGAGDGDDGRARRLGTGRGGSRCVLQVAASNEPAIALYDRLGFTEHHRYHYRLAP